MDAQRLMRAEVPPARSEDSAERALDLMDTFKVRALPVLDGEVFKGLVYEGDALQVDADTPVGRLPLRPVSVDPETDALDVVARFAAAETDVLPVVRDGRFLGSIQAHDVVRFLAERAGWAAEGGIVVLEVPENDLSVAELARLVEGNGVRVVALVVDRTPGSDVVEVSLRLNSPDVAPVLATFSRFGYSIRTLFHAPGLEEQMRERYEAFMRYLGT
jgi:acetoin utilization protein AcuB